MLVYLYAALDKELVGRQEKMAVLSVSLFGKNNPGKFCLVGLNVCH